VFEDLLGAWGPNPLASLSLVKKTNLHFYHGRSCSLLLRQEAALILVISAAGLQGYNIKSAALSRDREK